MNGRSRWTRLWAAALLACHSFLAAARTVEVQISALAFIPDQIAIQVGDRVEWVADASGHTVTADEGAFDSTRLWDTVPAGQRFGFTFEEPGIYRYFCGIHGGPGGSGMSGIVAVAVTGDNHPPEAPVNQLPPDGAVRQSLTPLLRSSTFSDPDQNDFHAASQWIVWADDDGGIVFDSGEDSISKLQRSVPLGILSELATYWWQVRHRDGLGAWSDYSNPTAFRTLRMQAATGTGLRTSYWNAPGTGMPLATSTNATVNFAWGPERPHRRITSDDFVVRWEGAVLAQFSERYEFDFLARGGAQIWINGDLVMDDRQSCPFVRSRKAWVPLVAGLPAAIRIDYVADPSGGLAVLRWSSPSLPVEVIPSSRLFPNLP